MPIEASHKKLAKPMLASHVQGWLNGTKDADLNFAQVSTLSLSAG